MRYRYTLTHDVEGSLVVEDPIGWDTLKLKLERSLDDAGVFHVFTEEKLTFWGTGKDFIEAVFAQDGVDAVVQCLIEVELLSGWENLFPIPVELDMGDYEVTKTTWTVGLIETGTQKKLRTRNDLKVALNSTASLDGTLMATFAQKDVTIPGRDILLGSIASATSNSAVPQDPLALTETGNEAEILDAANNRFFTSDAGKAGVWYIELSGTFSWIGQLGGAGIPYKVAGTTVGVLPLGAETDATNKQVTVTAVVFVAASQALTFVANGITGEYEFSVYRREPTPTYDARGELVYEAMAKVLQVVTDNTDPLRAPVLERTDSQPHSEASDGEYSLISLHSGLQLRGFPITLAILKVSWKELWTDGIRKLFNLGYEIDDNGRIAIAKREDFFLDELGQAYDYVDFQEEPAEDYYFNEVEVGYKRFFEEDERNSRDTVHTTQQWASPLLTIKNKLEIASGLIADMYKIAYKVRDRYANSSSTSREDDESPYIFHVRREASAYQVVQDEQATSITGVFSPGTVYNLLLTPKRIFLRWLNVIAASIWPDWGRLVRFVSAPANTRLVSQLTSESAAVAESANVAVLSSEALYYPNRLVFEKRMAKDQYDALWADRKKKHRINRDGVTHRYGFLLELEYEPERAMASIVLLETSAPTP